MHYTQSMVLVPAGGFGQAVANNRGRVVLKLRNIRALERADGGNIEHLESGKLLFQRPPVPVRPVVLVQPPIEPVVGGQVRRLG